MSTEAVSKLPADRKAAAQRQGFEGKTGQTLVLAGGDDKQIEVLVGIGPSKDLTTAKLRKAAASFARAVTKHGSVATNLMAHAGELDRAEALAAVAEGLRLSTYRFNQLRSDSSLKKNEVKLKTITIIASGRELRAELNRANAVIDAVELARDLVNEPGGSMTPQAFVAAAKKVTADTDVKLTVWNEARIKRERLGGVLAVNQGSEHPPQFLQLRYKPAKGRPKASVALVGKGVTFDSGGLSLKNSVGMMTMKIDMAGAAAVLATMATLPAIKAQVEVTGYIPLTDNMTGPDAQRPGDVFTARNGKTVEVLNTDAEGRLILADALSLAAESDADAIIEISTLTGSATAALGQSYAALLATDDDLAGRLEAASARTAEKLWRLPLPDEYRSQLDSSVADLRNIGTTPYGGALIAGLFLKEFVGDKPFAHVDLGLSAVSEASKGINVKGATGNGVRLLIDTLAAW
ncbi:MAG: leucyl aminopeptidase [Acidimicrobiia bacterium]|nr:leucyl aminopeptidase [Acidimicrobiia bacterium]